MRPKRCGRRTGTCSICASSGERLIDSFPTVMVMQDSATPRETHVLLRGAYDRPGEKVEPGVPGVLPPLPRGRCRTTGWAWRGGWSIRRTR